jgi:hypothetical protein
LSTFVPAELTVASGDQVFFSSFLFFQKKGRFYPPKNRQPGGNITEANQAIGLPFAIFYLLYEKVSTS